MATTQKVTATLHAAGFLARVNSRNPEKRRAGYEVVNGRGAWVGVIANSVYADRLDEIKNALRAAGLEIQEIERGAADAFFCR